MANSYHMIDYIHENPDALRRTLENNEQAIQDLMFLSVKRNIHNIVIIGVGSSFTAALIAAPSFRLHCPIPTHILPSTELGFYLPTLVDEHTLVVAVSRSGERGYVVDALKEARVKGATGVAMTGFGDSLLAQHAEIVLLTAEGPEITFAKTKSVIACAGLLIRLAIASAPSHDQRALLLLNELKNAPDNIQKTILELEPKIQSSLPELSKRDVFLIAGTLSNYGAAQEAAIKIPETSYTVTIAGDTGNILHGPWGPISKNGLFICIVSPYDLELSQRTLELARKYHAYCLTIIEPGLSMEGFSDEIWQVASPIDSAIAGLITLIPLQLLTYYLTIAKGMNPDEPPAMRELLKAFLPPGREEPELRS